MGQTNNNKSDTQPIIFSRGRWKSYVRRQMNSSHDPIPSKEEQQYALDQYLESIDRRYKRRRQNQKERKTEGISISNVLPPRVENDALTVFGLAGLASVQLLQKHKLPIPSNRTLVTEGQDEIQDSSMKNKFFIPPVLLAMALVRNVNAAQKKITRCCTVTSLKIRSSLGGFVQKSGLMLNKVFMTLVTISMHAIRSNFTQAFGALLVCVALLARSFDS